MLRCALTLPLCCFARPALLPCPSRPLTICRKQNPLGSHLLCRKTAKQSPFAEDPLNGLFLKKMLDSHHLQKSRSTVTICRKNAKQSPFAEKRAKQSPFAEKLLNSHHLQQKPLNSPFPTSFLNNIICAKPVAEKTAKQSAFAEKTLKGHAKNNDYAKKLESSRVCICIYIYIYNMYERVRDRAVQERTCIACNPKCH